MSKMRKLIVLTIIGLAVLVVLDNAQVEEQTQSLRETTNEMESSSENIDATISTRHEALMTLTQSLSSRTEEVNAMMRSFTGMVEESLASAEQTAREIGSMLGAHR